MQTNPIQQMKDFLSRRPASTSFGNSKFHPLKLPHFQRSSSRTEMPNKFKSIDVPKVSIESVYEHSNWDLADLGVPPTTTRKPMIPLVENESHQTKKPRSSKSFYYVEDNEILSFNKFFTVHKNYKLFQRRQTRLENRKKTEEKKKYIEEMSTSKTQAPTQAQTQTFPRSLSVPQIALTPDMSSPTHSPMHQEESQFQSVFIQSPFITQCVTPKAGGLGTAQEEKDFVQSLDLFKKKARHNVQSLQLSSPKIEELKLKLTDQKFTDKEVQKHLAWTLLSPKSEKQNPGGLKKEKLFSRMYKDAKAFDVHTENSIRKAKNIIIKKSGMTSTSHSRNASQVEKVETRPDSLKSITDLAKENNTEGESFKKAQMTTRRIEENIRFLDRVLKSSTPNQKSPSPIKSTRTLVLKPKNKFPLRTDIAQKYQLEEKAKDHKTATYKMRKISSMLKKEVKDSAVKNQTYVGYFH